MVANIYVARRHILEPGVGSKGQTIFLCFISNKRVLSTEHHETNMLSLHTPTTSGVASNGHVFFFFSKSGHGAYKIKMEEV